MKKSKISLSFLYKGIEESHKKTILYINLFVILGVLLILLKTSVYLENNPSLLPLRFVGPYIVTFIGATIGASLVSKSSQKINYALKSILLFIIYALTPLYPSFYIIRLFVLPLHGISLLLGFLVSFVINPIIVNRLRINKTPNFIINNKKVFSIITLIILFLVFYPAAIFGINPACLAYGNGQGFGIFGSDPIYWENQRGCFNLVATLTLNEKYCDALNYGQDDCYTRLAGIKNNPEVCVNNEFYDYDSGNCIYYLFKKNTKPGICEALLINRTRVTVENQEQEHDTCLQELFDFKTTYDIYDESMCNSMLLDSNKNSCFSQISDKRTKELETKKQTIFLLEKYKNILKDWSSFKNELTNPKDIDFCKLMSLFREDGTVLDEDNSFYVWSDEPYKVTCYGNFGKNPEAKEICKGGDPNHGWQWICQGGIAFNDHITKNTTYHDIGNTPFQYGFGAAAGNTDFDLSKFLNSEIRIEDSGGKNIPVTDEYYLDRYFEMKNFVESMKPIKFCNTIRSFNKECKEIVKS